MLKNCDYFILGFMKHFMCPKTDAHWIHKIKWFTFRQQKPCFLELTIFEIAQSKSNFLPCLAMAMNSGLLCPRWLYLHSQCALSRCDPRAAAYAVAAFHASSRELACEPHWCHTSRRRCKLSAARRLAHTARRTPCTALSSLC